VLGLGLAPLRRLTGGGGGGGFRPDAAAGFRRPSADGADTEADKWPTDRRS